MHRLRDSCAVLISQDSFYRPLTDAERKDVTGFNFDHPDAFDSAALMDCVYALKVRVCYRGWAGLVWLGAV